MALLDRGGQEHRRLPPTRSSRPLPTIGGLATLLRPGNDNKPRARRLPSELDCLVGVLPAQLLRDAASRGRDLRLGADRVLIAWGAISEADYLQRLARHSGIAIATLTDITRAEILLHDDDLKYAAQYGVLPMRERDDLMFVVAPRGMAARRLTAFVESFPEMVPRLRLASTTDVDDFLLHRAGGAMAHHASYGLRDSFPKLSSAPKMVHRPWRNVRRRAGVSLGLAGVLMLPTDFALGVWTQLLAMWFVAAIGLRCGAALLPQASRPDTERIADADLPVYSVIAALHHEARVVPQLLSALNALDYPREKLDIIVVVEADDAATRAAIARFGAMPHLRVMVAPETKPRTKPKALNCALPFARGDVVAVFDAEDRPDPGQLRAALDAFGRESDDVACVQASLCIDNTADSLFTRMFAAEYAGQFDAVLPGLAAIRLPLPLGGTSNHFRADALRAVGGWDAWNMTEDADLGLRLARFGYRAVTFPSTTQEEAPITFLRWVRQRTRWMKGWMQTLGVHMRAPRQFWRDAGWRGVITLNFILAGPIVSALAYPVFLLALMWQAAFGEGWLLDGLLQPAHLLAISSGIIATVVIGLIGLARRGRLRDGWILLLTPLYWGCLSIATYRALLQLLCDPYRWEKTEHGLTGRARGVKDILSRAQRKTKHCADVQRPLSPCGRGWTSQRLGRVRGYL